MVSVMRRVLLLLPLLLGGCSCQPESARAPGDRSPPQDVSAADPQPQDASAAEVEHAAPAVVSAVAAGAADETTTIRNYINVLLRPDRSASDAFWTGGSAGSRPDDQVLRGIPNLRTLRVDTEQPISRDSAVPSRLREVPVRVRAVTAEDTFFYEGWYRVQPRVDGSGWEIVGASVQPVLR